MFFIIDLIYFCKNAQNPCILQAYFSLYVYDIWNMIGVPYTLIPLGDQLGIRTMQLSYEPR